MGVQHLIFKEALQKYIKVPAEHLTEYVGFSLYTNKLTPYRLSTHPIYISNFQLFLTKKGHGYIKNKHARVSETMNFVPTRKEN